MVSKFYIFVIGIIFGIVIFGSLYQYQNKTDVEQYEQCIKTYEQCDMSSVLNILSKKGDILMSDINGDWYIRYEVQEGDGLEYKIKSGYHSTPKYAFYSLLHNIKLSGLEI